MPYCSKCGHNIPANVRFCTACGAPVNGNGQNNLNNQSAQNPQSGQNYQSYQNPQNTQNLPPQPPAASVASQMAVPPPPPPAPSAAPTSPLPPPTPGSQPGSYRVQMMRYKEASQPPQYSTTPPASYVQQQQAQRRQSSHRSSGSSSGGCFRRGFHILTAAIAMIASLSWGIRSAFPNLNFGNMGSIFNVFSSCTGGNQGGGLLGNNNGGLFGGLLDGGKSSGGETSDDAPSAKGYERVFTDAEMTDIFEAGFPQTDEDHGVCFGVFESEQELQGKNVAFELKKASPGEDKRLVGKFVLILNGKVEQEGYLCYCGHSIYSLFDNIEDIDHASNASGIWYVSADGKSLSIYDNGEEKMKWTLKE